MATGANNIAPKVNYSPSKIDNLLTEKCHLSLEVGANHLVYTLFDTLSLSYVLLRDFQFEAKNIEEVTNKVNDQELIKDQKKINAKIIQYIVGDVYFIEGVKYEPKENYEYNEIGLASYYGKELHNKKTLNNDYNKVTELYGRHKTLPLPSILKITNFRHLRKEKICIKISVSVA